MNSAPPRKVDRRRSIRDVVAYLEAFPREYAALEYAMSQFGEDFDLTPFKSAFETVEDMAAYNRVQAVERAVGRVQNYVAHLAHHGAMLAEFPPAAAGSQPKRAFETLRDAKVISAALCRRLTRAQSARVMIEHGYVDSAAGDVHRATLLVHESSFQFIAQYRPWVEPLIIG